MPIDPTAVEAVVAEIEAAFGGLTPPGDDTLLHPRCMDDNDIAEFYGAPEWRALPDAFLIRNYAAPSFFSPEAFRYYMPAFMVWSLRHADSVEYAPEATLRAFDPDAAGPALRDFQLSKFALFDEAQRRAVVAFLEAFRGAPDLGSLAKQALQNHWKPER